MIYDAHRKSTGAAYLLWLFLGGFGAHRFYLGQTGTAVTQLVLLLLGWIPLFAGWVILGIWLFVDLFLIPGIARDENLKIADRLTR
jgi:TM2 domain-containing membrane protein YozV